MPDALSPQFGQMGTGVAPKPPAPISAPPAKAAPTPLPLSAGTFTSFQQHTAWRTPTDMPYSAQAGGTVLNFGAGSSEPPPTN